MRDHWVTKLSFKHLQLDIFNEKKVIRVEEEKCRLPVDVRGSKTSVLKLSNITQGIYRLRDDVKSAELVQEYYTKCMVCGIFVISFQRKQRLKTTMSQADTAKEPTLCTGSLHELVYDPCYVLKWKLDHSRGNFLATNIMVADEFGCRIFKYSEHWKFNLVNFHCRFCRQL